MCRHYGGKDDTASLLTARAVLATFLYLQILVPGSNGTPLAPWGRNCASHATGRPLWRPFFFPTRCSLQRIAEGLCCLCWGRTADHIRVSCKAQVSDKVSICNAALFYHMHVCVFLAFFSLQKHATQLHLDGVCRELCAQKGVRDAGAERPGQATGSSLVSHVFKVDGIVAGRASESFCFLLVCLSLLFLIFIRPICCFLLPVPNQAS